VRRILLSVAFAAIALASTMVSASADGWPPIPGTR
jgi:hypothetical protein